MMKRKILLILVAIMLFAFIGCGKKEPEVIEETPVLEIEQSEGEEEIQIEVTDENDVIEEQPVYFECAGEIMAAEPKSGLLQVDDMIFQYGCTVAEALEVINGSECTYTTESNENQLVTKNGFVQMVFKKDGEWYFEFDATNLTEETIELKDCIINRITVHEAAKGNFYCAGVYNSDNAIMTYNEVKEIMKDYTIFYEHEYYRYDERVLNLAYTMESSKSSSNKLYIFFLFDNNTGELKMISFSSSSSSHI